MSSNSTGNPFNKRRSRGRGRYRKEGEYPTYSRGNNYQRPRNNQNHFTKFHDNDREKVYDNNWFRDSGACTNRMGSNQSYNTNVVSEQPGTINHFNNVDHSGEKVPSRYHSTEKENVSTGAETGANNSIDKTPHIVLNIKKENDPKAAKSLNIGKKKVDTSSSSSSSSSSSDSDSEDSATKKLQKVFDNKILSKGETNGQSSKPVVKKETTAKVAKPSSDESSDSDSSSDNEEPNKKQKPKPAPEEDVIFLGKLENIENLVDDDEESGEKKDNEICILCDKKGHTSFNCQMICKNCGAQYHNLKTCPEPANVSVVLQSFMEFCMNQCYQYNPKEKFAFKNDLHSRVPLTSFPRLFSSEYEDNEINQPRISKRKRHSNRSRSSIAPSVSSKHSKKKLNTTDSDSSLDESFSRRRKSSKHPNSSIDNITPTMPNYSTSLPFTSPFPFPYNPQSLAFNPMLAFSHMMGFNPAVNFANTLTKDK